MKRLSKTWIAVVLMLTVCLSAGMICYAEQEAVIPMEVNDDTLLQITEELLPSLALKLDHLDFYTSPQEILELGESAKEVLAMDYSGTSIVPVDTLNIVMLMMSNSDQDLTGISQEDLLTMLGGHIGSTLISVVNAQMGATNTAFTSIATTGRNFVADLDQEYLVILEYDGPFSVAADFYTSGEHVVTASEVLVSTESIPQLLSMLEGIFQE